METKDKILTENTDKPVVAPLHGAPADWQADVTLQKEQKPLTSGELLREKAVIETETVMESLVIAPQTKTKKPAKSQQLANVLAVDFVEDEVSPPADVDADWIASVDIDQEALPLSENAAGKSDAVLEEAEGIADEDAFAAAGIKLQEEANIGMPSDWQAESKETPAIQTKHFGKKTKKPKEILPPLTKKIISLEGFVAVAVLLALFVPIGAIMGFSGMMRTLFANGLELLINTCFYLLAVSVIIGALSSVLSEFGTVSILNKALAPLMKPIYGMPGATSMAIFSSFMSDNPAVLTLAGDRRYRSYFKKYQLATLTNVGTSFGMGLVVVALMMTKEISGGSMVLAVSMGIVGSLIGSVVSTRLMLRKCKKVLGTTEDAEPKGEDNRELYRDIREGGTGQRFISSLLDGGTDGVKVGFSIIPGVLIIANLILLLTNGKPAGGYTGGANEGVALIPFLGEKLGWLFKWLFGFSDPSAISIPLTALGSAGAAMGIIDQAPALFTANEMAVFTAMCMFWSGYLSTHVAMMDGMGFRKLTGWSILFHTIAGLVAGVSANYLYQLFALLL